MEGDIKYEVFNTVGWHVPQNIFQHLRKTSVILNCEQTLQTQTVRITGVSLTV